MPPKQGISHILITIIALLLITTIISNILWHCWKSTELGYNTSTQEPIKALLFLKSLYSFLAYPISVSIK